jgi:hypothetical protein
MKFLLLHYYPVLLQYCRNDQIFLHDQLQPSQFLRMIEQQKVRKLKRIIQSLPNLRLPLMCPPYPSQVSQSVHQLLLEVLLLFHFDLLLVLPAPVLILNHHLHPYQGHHHLNLIKLQLLLLQILNHPALNQLICLLHHHQWLL